MVRLCYFSIEGLPSLKTIFHLVNWKIESVSLRWHQFLLWLTAVNSLVSRSAVWKDCGCYKSLNSNGGLHAQCSGIGDNFDWYCLKQINMNSLDISRNNLTEIPAVLISSMFSNLTDLDLSYNNITKIPDEVILRIDRLNISHNQLSELPVKPNNTMTTLNDLDVSYNNLTSIRSLLSKIAEHIKSDGNSLKCECNNDTLIELIYERIANGQLDRVMCMDRGSSKLKLITNVPSCHRQINNKTNEPEVPWSMSILVLAVALLVYISFAYTTISKERIYILIFVDSVLFLALIIISS